MPIGDKIKKFRTSKGLKQSDLADLAGISRVTIGFYERGENQPTFDVAAKIAQALEIPINQLLENPYDIFRTPEFVFMDWLAAFGYKVDGDMAEGYLWISDISSSLDYEITEAQLGELEKNIGAYTKFQVQELLKTCRSLPSKPKDGEPNAKKEAE